MFRFKIFFLYTLLLHIAIQYNTIQYFKKQFNAKKLRVNTIQNTNTTIYVVCYNTSMTIFLNCVCNMYYNFFFLLDHFNETFYICKTLQYVPMLSFIPSSIIFADLYTLFYIFVSHRKIMYIDSLFIRLSIDLSCSPSLTYFAKYFIYFRDQKLLLVSNWKMYYRK